MDAKAWFVARFIAWTFTAFAVFVVVIDIGEIAVNGLSGPRVAHLAGDLLFPVIPVAVLCVLANIYLIPQLQQRSELFRAAREGAHDVPLAEPQPTPDANALPLPATIVLKPHLAAIVMWLGGMFSLVVAIMVPHEIHVSDTRDLGIGYLLFTAVGVMLVICVAMSAGAIYYSRTTIHITDEGLSIRRGDETQNIHWSDARLFAIIAINGTRYNPAAISYQLSSQRVVSRWVEVRHAALLLFVQPVESIVSHEREMHALLQVIAARTGLPLLDLR